MPTLLTAKDVMEKNVVIVDGSTSVSQAIDKMVSLNIWSLVVENNGLPVGVVTERDILRRCLGKKMKPDGITVAEVMSSPLISVKPDEHVGKVMQLMVEKDIRRIFVIDNGKIIGRITQTKLFDDSLNVMLELLTIGYQM